MIFRDYIRAVGKAPVARSFGVSIRTVESWASGSRVPETTLAAQIPTLTRQCVTLLSEVYAAPLKKNAARRG